MKLVWKLALPQIVIIAILGLISYTVINTSFRGIRDYYIRDVVENRIRLITREIDTKAQKSVSESSMFVRLPVVLQAYELALSGDIDDPYSPKSQAARELLREKLAPILDSHNDITGKKLQVHFHLHNGYSLVRLWLDRQIKIDGQWVDISDDLRSFRPTVLDVNRDGQIAMGLEPGRGGFAIRGVVPVLTPNGEQIGSAEVLQAFDPILDVATENEKIYISLYANVELLDFSVELQDAEKHPPKGDFVRVVQSKDAQVESLITPELLSDGKKGIVFKEHESVTLAAFPLDDYRGNQVGVIICAMNTEAVNSLASTATVILTLILACMAIVPVVALLLGLRLTVIRPLGLIKAKIQNIAEDRADLREQLPSRQHDEIGELARWFNTLTAKVYAILQERQEMAHWYKSILDSMPFPISVQDMDMKWTFINVALEKLLGKKREDVIGLPCSNWDICICNSANCAVACAKRGLKQTHFLYGGASYQVDVETLRNLQGESTGFIEVIQNVTQLEQLARQEAEAMTASRAKSDFLANMSHEIRTPMNAITGMIAIGKGSNDLERIKYVLSKIEDASAHLLGIINDILDMSKIEAGKFELSGKEFNLERMLQRVVNVMAFRVAEKRQKFSLYMDKDMPPVLFGDDQRLAQIITNLLSNAVKFTPEEGSINLNAKFLEELDSICKIQIEVVDSGIGISPEQQVRLFQPFHQAEKSTSRKFGGTGLGLSISKSIAEMMGGKIWIESELGKGATFAFTMRMKRGGSRKYEIVDKNSNWKDLRILTVDENIALLGYLKNLTENFGAFCDTAVCGAEALELTRRNGAYDIYFVDWKITDMDALQLAQDLRAIGPDKNQLAVPMISSVEWGEIEESAKKAGIDKFLTKPLFPSDIANVINGFLGVVKPQTDETTETNPLAFRGKRVLLVEDVEINREILLTLLEPMLLEIDCAVNGAEAVRLFQKAPERYDIILMDVQMPEMDGYEATQKIRALAAPRAKTIPIVAMTANVFRDDIEKCLKTGMNDHIGKPLDMDEVLKKLCHYLGSC